MENSDLENELVKYQPDMIKYAVYLTNDYEYALDIVQDVNYQILKNRDKFESRQYSLKISFIFIKIYKIKNTRLKLESRIALHKIFYDALFLKTFTEYLLVYL